MKLKDAKHMTVRRFYNLFLDAVEQPDQEHYAHGYGYPEWFDEISEDPYECIEYLEKIHDIAHKPIRELLEPYGLKEIALCRLLVLPRRTADNWLAGINEPPDWVKLLIIQRLDDLTDADGDNPDDFTI